MTTRIVCLGMWMLSAGMAQQPRQIGAGVNFYSLEKEVALGNQVAAEFRKSHRMLESPVVAAYVNGIGQRLVSQMGGPPFTYRFEVYADDSRAMPEVAALPGGFVFVPTSLMLAVYDEDELAGMLAHGIAHVASRHGTKQATKAELVDRATIPLIYMGGWSGAAMRQGQAQAIPMGMLQTVRKFELDADVLAARAMAAAGYDPAALARYIERVQSPDEGEPKVWSALPARWQRLAAIREVIAGLGLQVYRTHEGLTQAQEEVKRVTTRPETPPKAPPTLRK
jgi:predicted Zn-dependent protease